MQQNTNGHISTASPKDLEEIWEYLDSSFGYEPGSFLNDIPWQWNAECVEWDNTFIIRDESRRLASLVRIWELQLIQDGRTVTVGGIGSVATSVHARGQGCMSALMEYTGREMQRRGYPLAILSGDRFRYEPFGFQSAGRTLNLNVTARGLKRRGIEPLAPVPFNDEVLARIETIRAQTPYHVRRRSCETKYVYRAARSQVLAAEEEEFAFLVFDGSTLREWGGDVHTALRLAAFAAQENLSQSFNFAMPFDVPAPEELLQVISDWSLTPMCSAAIYDLDKTLQLFDAVEYHADLAEMTPHDQVWHLFGKLNAPRNIWLSPVDMI